MNRFANFPVSFPFRFRRAHPKVKFTPEEDDRLRSVVASFGENDWEQVAKNMPGRNQRQCRERWLNYLSPNVNTAPWTSEEDQLLREKHAELGPKWVQIAKNFVGRSDTAVKNRWMVLERKARNEREEKFIPVPLPKTTEEVKAKTDDDEDKWKAENERDFWDEVFANACCGAFEW